MPKRERDCVEAKQHSRVCALVYISQLVRLWTRLYFSGLKCCLWTAVLHAEHKFAHLHM